jgi:DNA-binding beta-propeller fold protein YncE
MTASIILVVSMLALLGGPNLETAAAAHATAPAALACGEDVTGTPATTTGPAPTPSGTPAAPTEPVLQLVADVPLPGSTSRFDYQSFDESTGRLAIAHMGADQVIVFDARTQQVVGTVDGVKTPTGVLVVPDLRRIFAAAAGSHTVAIINADSLDVIAQTGQIGFPDGLAYAPPVKQVFVSDESGGGELVIDATSNNAVTTIDIGGKAGNTHYDPVSGCILVAVQNQNQLVVIDPTTDRLVSRHDLDADCQTPHGFLIDAPRRLAFVTCQDNALLLVVDLRTMAVAATYPVDDNPDVLAFDPDWRRLYVASEAGRVAIFDEWGAALQPVGEYRAPHAHSVAVDPQTHRVYLPLEDVDGKPVLRILAAMPPQSEA